MLSKQIYIHVLLFLSIDSLVSKQGGLDGPALIVGVHTILHQFHPEVLKQFLIYFGQLVRSYHEAGLQ
jgi:hypothetical protein